ncbi:hypothetical protein O181_009719 [Austropuccinia psidii MF-1]|uniref:Chromo domain-containing protein n=1 Tax=Austropuccinia psidii MF-1 TaxID=1389203 RepID=A0A9Q3GK49_9BASI|nr:hypothetical protein [Austropuccinia psidii MF-1]
MWRKACETAARCIAEANEYNKKRYDKTHREPNLKEGDQVLIDRENAVEVQLTEEFSRKHPVVPVSLVKSYHQTGENKFPSRRKNPTSKEIVEVEDSPGPVKEIIKARNIRLNGKDHRKYLIRFKKQTADKGKWVAEDSIRDGELHLIRLRASTRAEQSHQ